MVTANMATKIKIGTKDNKGDGVGLLFIFNTVFKIRLQISEYFLSFIPSYASFMLFYLYFCSRI